MDADKFLKHRDDLVQQGVDFLKARTIGRHVIELVARDGEISVASLFDSLNNSIGPATPEKERLLAEAALACLQELRAERG